MAVVADFFPVCGGLALGVYALVQDGIGHGGGQVQQGGGGAVAVGVCGVGGFKCPLDRFKVQPAGGLRCGGCGRFGGGVGGVVHGLPFLSAGVILWAVGGGVSPCPVPLTLGILS